MIMVKNLTIIFYNYKNINLRFSSINNPQSNACLERFHATLMEMLRADKLGNTNEYPLTILPYVIICYNNTKNNTHSFTPYELIFGHTSGRPSEKLYN